MLESIHLKTVGPAREMKAEFMTRNAERVRSATAPVVEGRNVLITGREHRAALDGRTL
jgi:hypothetical protein